MGLFYTIPQGHCMVIESFGKYSKILHAGLRVKYPWQKIRPVIEWGDVANKDSHGPSTLIELTEQQIDTDARSYFTSDNVKVNVDALVRWKIIDPRKAVYEIDDDLPHQFVETVLSALRAKVGKMALDEVNSERGKISEDISTELRATCKGWGILVSSVEIKELIVDGSTSKMMMQQAEAERHGRSVKIQAEADAKAKIMTALAEKKVKILVAEGEKVALSLRAEAEQLYLKKLESQIGKESATKVLMADKAIEGYRVLSSNPSDKVIFHDGSGPNMILNESWGKTVNEP